MKINDIREIINNNGIVEILIGVELDPNSTNIWELEDPSALIIYKSHGKLKFDHIDLVDRGMKVHGYEFTESEEKKIIDFLQDRNIDDMI
ncbi:hypothetical protein [Maledivibacter halophilus]|uniref:Uncharacterized protein n=1 Tax=Maledivibacter halophilus TaxID=36842 RepID=A0A1T5JAV2_9FIRM|nr:hypothetical protein [Maledivibacter halophilus]SKC48519.1 hypothetical protein SAMN02194393_01051 [Maledivibacter halophilus]